MYKKQNCSIIPKSSFQYNDCYDYEYYNCHKNIHRVYLYGNYNYYYNMYHNIDTKWCNPCNNSHKKQDVNHVANKDVIHVENQIVIHVINLVTIHVVDKLNKIYYHISKIIHKNNHIIPKIK